MMNKFRLSSNAFERESEEEKILPKKVFFISIEGNVNHVDLCRQICGIQNFEESIKDAD